MKKSTKFLTGTAIVAGSALGVLFAPDKGSATRRKVNRQIQKFRGRSYTDRKMEKLLMAKHKLEEDKARIEAHLTKIQSIIDELGGKPSSTEQNIGNSSLAYK